MDMLKDGNIFYDGSFMLILTHLSS